MLPTSGTTPSYPISGLLSQTTPIVKTPIQDIESNRILENVIVVSGCTLHLLRYDNFLSYFLDKKPGALPEVDHGR